MGVLLRAAMPADFLGECEFGTVRTFCEILDIEAMLRTSSLSAPESELIRDRAGWSLEARQ